MTFDETIKHIDRLFENEDERDGGYQAFVHMRRIWPELKRKVVEVEQAAWRTDIENAPRDGTQILGRWNTDLFGVVTWIDGSWRDDSDSEHGISDPTHWKLIEAPQVSSTHQG